MVEGEGEQGDIHDLARRCFKDKGKKERLFVNETATTEIYTLALHDALPNLMP